MAYYALKGNTRHAPAPLGKEMFNLGKPQKAFCPNVNDTLASQVSTKCSQQQHGSEIRSSCTILVCLAVANRLLHHQQ